MARSKGSPTNADGEFSSTKPRRKTTNGTGHDCNICRKSNMTLSGLKIHLLTHSGEKPFTCTVCDKRFTCSSNLKKHQRIHNRDYIYKCEVCGKTCSDPSNMKKHMTVHSDEKAFKCPSCGKAYSYAQSLRQHMDDVHVGNGDRRRKNKKKGHFPCPECGKVFGYYWRCSLHQARVHAVDKPYKCPECGKAFARETILNKHIQTHEKPYPCMVCERKFSFRDQLRKHMRTHTGERPYTCEHCLRSFTQRGSLTEHIRTHTGEKPFACDNCGQKFSSSSSLKRHQRRINACLTVNFAEEIPVDNRPRKLLYINTPPVTIMRDQLSTSPQSMVIENGDPSMYTTRVFPIENSFTGTASDYESSLVTGTDEIATVPSSCIAGNDAETPPRGIKRTATTTSDFQPQILRKTGRITLVSASNSYTTASRGSQPSLVTKCQSLSMDCRDCEQFVPMVYPVSLSCDNVKPNQPLNETITVLPGQPQFQTSSVTLTTDGVKPLVPVTDAVTPNSCFQTMVPAAYQNIHYVSVTANSRQASSSVVTRAPILDSQPSGVATKDVGSALLIRAPVIVSSGDNGKPETVTSTGPITIKDRCGKHPSPGRITIVKIAKERTPWKEEKDRLESSVTSGHRSSKAPNMTESAKTTTADAALFPLVKPSPANAGRNSRTLRPTKLEKSTTFENTLQHSPVNASSPSTADCSNAELKTKSFLKTPLSSFGKYSDIAMVDSDVKPIIGVNCPVVHHSPPLLSARNSTITPSALVTV